MADFLNYDDFEKDIYDKRNKGAFYTNLKYSAISAEIVKNIVKSLNGKDYVILDRCAGTGNLEATLPNDILQHCIMSTIQECEYEILKERFDGKVKCICKPFDALNGIVPEMKEYLFKDDIEVIMLENPPYSASNSIENQKEGKSKIAGTWKESFFPVLMKEKKIPSTDMCYAFIWSAFEVYKVNHYICYAPIKYWKKDHLINKEHKEAYLFNRKLFNAPTPAAISCIHWLNNEAKDDTIIFEKVNSTNEGKISCSRVKNSLTKEYYPKQNNSSYPKGIYVSYDGFPKKLNATVKPVDNPNYIGYLVCSSTEFNNPRLHVCLTTEALAYGGGFYLDKKDFLKYLPLYCVGEFGDIHSEWYNTAFMMKSGDKAKEYFKDIEDGKLDKFLLDCLLFTCLSRQNHCVTFEDNGRIYHNELTLDHRFRDTEAWKILKNHINDYQEIYNLWEKILSSVKSDKNVGFYEIDEFYNTEKKSELDNCCWEMKSLTKKFYDNNIFPILQRYEMIK